MGKRGGFWLALLCFCSISGGSEGLWSIGTRVQGFVDFEPGNDYVVGPEIGYSNYQLGSHRLQLKAAYLTTRMEQYFRENVLRQDYFLFSPVWHFGRNSLFDPTVQLDLGYTRYDVESHIFKDLDNDTWIASAQVGFCVNLFQGEYGLFYHFGYNFIAPESSMVLPGLFGVGLWVML